VARRPNSTNITIWQPGEGVLKREQARGAASAAISNHHPGKVDREETATAHRSGPRIYNHRTRTGEERLQTGRQRQSIQETRHRPSAGEAESRADQPLLGNNLQNAPAGRLDIGYCQNLRHRDGHKDGDGIVGGRLDLERRPDALLELQPAGMEEEEDRRRVSRGDNRS
jgi:hypothetical protein